MKSAISTGMAASLLLIMLIVPAFSGSAAFKDNIYNPGQLKPVDSQLKVKIGEPAPDFTLPSVAGKEITRDIQVNDINQRPDLEYCATTLDKLNNK